MNMEKSASTPAGRKKMPGWKKGLIGFAASTFVLGAGLKGYDLIAGKEEPPAAAPGGSTSAPGQTSLVGRTPSSGEARAEAEEPSADWSRALMTGGLSFFVAFCVGYALRTFFKFSAVVLGAVLLGIFALSYLGVLHVDWQTLEGHFNRALAAVKEEASQFQTFLTGSLPSAGAAAAGLFTGFKRNR